MNAEHAALQQDQQQKQHKHSAITAPPLVVPLPATPPAHVMIVAMGASMAAFTQLACSHGGIEAIADEVWAINATASVIKHHRAFVMDDLRVTIPREAEEGKKVAQGILHWLPSHPGPVYSSTAYPEYPALVEFPIAEVLQSIGGHPYLNTTVAYAMAYAMHLGAKQISLYGCDFTYPDVHVSESGRGCVEYLVGLACARGVKIQMPATTTLLDAHVDDDRRLYGYIQPISFATVDGKLVAQRGPLDHPAPPPVPVDQLELVNDPESPASPAPPLALAG